MPCGLPYIWDARKETVSLLVLSSMADTDTDTRMIKEYAHAALIAFMTVHKTHVTSVVMSMKYADTFR